MSFASTLRSLRKKHNLTQSDLAKELGVTQRTISYYESGKGTPSDTKILNALVKLFNVTLDELLLDSQGVSKLTLLVNKLIDDTKNNKLEWEPFVLARNEYTTDSGFHGSSLYADIFRLDSFSQYDNYSFLMSDSFFASYKDGGYLVAKILSPTNDIDIALFILHNDKFSYIANKDSIKQLDDLYFILTNPSLGVSTFIDEYLGDDLSNKGSSPTSVFAPDKDCPF